LSSREKRINKIISRENSDDFSRVTIGLGYGGAHNPSVSIGGRERGGTVKKEARGERPICVVVYAIGDCGLDVEIIPSRAIFFSRKSPLKFLASTWNIDCNRLYNRSRVTVHQKYVDHIHRRHNPAPPYKHWCIRSKD